MDKTLLLRLAFVAVIVALGGAALVFLWRRSSIKKVIHDNFTQRDADFYKTVITSYQRVLERNPTSQELELGKHRLEKGKMTIGQLVDMLVSSEEYKRLHSLQSNDFNTGITGDVTYRQVLLKLGKLYKDVFGTPKIPKEHLSFLVEKYMHEYQLDDAKMKALLQSILKSDKQRTRLSPETVDPDPVLSLLNSHIPGNTGAGAESVMESGADQQQVQAYLQDIIAQTQPVKNNTKTNTKTNAKTTTNRIGNTIKHVVHEMSEIASDIKVNVGKLKLRSSSSSSNEGSTSSSTSSSTNNKKASHQQKQQQVTLLLDAPTANMAASMLPIPPPPPVCIGPSTTINPLMQQTSLLGTLLEDVQDSAASANTNVYRTVKV